MVLYFSRLQQVGQSCPAAFTKKATELVPEEDNEHENFVVAIKFKDRIVGHVPKNLSKTRYFTLKFCIIPASNG